MIIEPNIEALRVALVNGYVEDTLIDGLSTQEIASALQALFDVTATDMMAHPDYHILIIQISHDHKFVLLGFESGDLILFHYKDLFTIDPIKAETEPLSNCFNLPIKHLLRVHRD